MCRNIRVLHHFEPPTTEEEMRAAALQYVRKVSGRVKPLAGDEAIFDKAVDEIAAITSKLLHALTPPRTSPRTREQERERAKARGVAREQRSSRGPA